MTRGESAGSGHELCDEPGRAEQFLAQPHVGVLSVVDDGLPLTVPVWYNDEPGGLVRVVTGQQSRKEQAVRASGWVCVCAQDEAWPYKYVTASGPAAVAG